MNPIFIKGSKFFDTTTGTQFFPRVIFYGDPGRDGGNSTKPIDTIADEKNCERDIPNLLNMGINTISVVGTNTTGHACMRLLQDARLYVLVEINGSNEISFWNDGSPWIPFDNALLKHSQAVYDNFQTYSNVLGFRIRIRDKTEVNLKSMPIKKALIRELKEYARNKGYRNIPVGIDGADHGSTTLFDYMTCGNDLEAPDFYALNVGSNLPLDADEPRERVYLNSSIEYFIDLRRRYNNVSVPVLLRYGYRMDNNHTFDEVRLIYESPMTDVFSGAMFGQWFDDRSRGGKDNGLVEVTNKVTLRPQYYALSSQLDSIRPNITEAVYVTTTNSRPACHNITLIQGQNTLVNLTADLQLSSTLPSKLYPPLCTCMLHSLSCIADQNASLSTIYERLDKECKQSREMCQGINSNSSSGHYDSFSSCEKGERLSWVLNQAHISSGNDSAACTSVGGLTQQPTPTFLMSNDCQVLLRQAGPSGTGTITSFPAPQKALNTSKPSDFKSLGPGSKVGIIIGILVTMSIVTAFFVIYLRAKRKRKASLKRLDSVQKPELPGISSRNGSPSSDTRDELDGAIRIELSAPHRDEIGGKEVLEMQGDLGIQELPAAENELAELDSRMMPRNK